MVEIKWKKRASKDAESTSFGLKIGRRSLGWIALVAITLCVSCSYAFVHMRGHLGVKTTKDGVEIIRIVEPERPQALEKHPQELRKEVERIGVHPELPHLE